MFGGNAKNFIGRENENSQKWRKVKAANSERNQAGIDAGLLKKAFHLKNESSKSVSDTPVPQMG